MKRSDLDIYRDLYEQAGKAGRKNRALADIWDKVTEVLEDRGMNPHDAERTALQVTEWIRREWGGLILIERHIGDPRPSKPKAQGDDPELIQVPVVERDPLYGSRFAGLRDQVLTVLAKAAPEWTNLAKVAMKVVQAVRQDWAGRYIPRIQELDRLQRDREIWDKATTPTAVEAAAREHNISIIRVYQARKAYQKRKNRIEQPVLPFGDTNA